MQNRRERRKLLKKFGLLELEKKRSSTDRLKEGKERHRLNLQEMKNSEIKKSTSDGDNIEENDFFVYRNLESSYDNLQSFFINKDWDELEND
jgi:hypothetical protein